MESIKKNFLYNIIYQILLVILPLITAPYISRTLGANSVGIYSYTNSVAYYFLLFAMLGISNHGNRMVAKNRENKEQLNKTFSSIYLFQFMTFSIAILIYILYVIYGVKENKLISCIQLIYVISGMLDISWLFFGLEKFKVTVTRNIIIKIITVICIFLFVHTPNDLWKYTLIMTLGTLLSQMYLWMYVKKVVIFKFVKLKDIFDNFKPIMTLFIPVLAFSIYKVMDKIMLGNMSDYVQVGYYNNAEKIINIPMGIITALGTVMLPRMSNMTANGEKNKAEQYIKISIKLVTIIASAIAFGLIGVSDVLAPVFFGNQFSACAPLIALLSITVFFISWANVVRTQYLIPNHYDKVYLSSTIIGAILNLTINLLLIPKFKANGAAIGTIIAEFAVMFVQLMALRKCLPVYKEIFNYFPVMIIGVIMMGIVKTIGNILGITIISLVSQIAIGGIIYCIALVAYMKISNDELGKIIFEMINKRKKTIKAKMS